MKSADMLVQVDGVKLVEDGHDPVAVLVRMAEAGAGREEFLHYVNAVRRHHPETFGKALARFASPDFKDALADVSPRIALS